MYVFVGNYSKEIACSVLISQVSLLLLCKRGKNCTNYFVNQKQTKKLSQSYLLQDFPSALLLTLPQNTFYKYPHLESPTQDRHMFCYGLVPFPSFCSFCFSCLPAFSGCSKGFHGDMNSALRECGFTTSVNFIL